MAKNFKRVLFSFFILTQLVFFLPDAFGADTTGSFPVQTVFEPPRASLREPGITFRYFQDSDNDIGEANIGGRLIFWGWERSGVTYQVGIEGGAFSTFRMDTDPMELKNTDYRVAFPLYFQKGNLSGRFQVYHQSSHLGDTYQRHTGRESIHWSREKVDLLLAKTMGRFKVYLGGGILFNVDPEVDEGTIEGGWEYRRPLSKKWGFYFSQDLQSRAEVDWNLDLATQTGFGLHDKTGKERMRFFLEYFRGHSPQGQFSNDTEEWAGLGSTLFL